MARSALRHVALRFTVWDLVPALDLLGLLPATRTTRTLACVKRGLLVEQASATPAEVLTSLDGGAGWAAFERLLS